MCNAFHRFIEVEGSKIELEKFNTTSTMAVIPHQELKRYIAGTSQRSEIRGKIA